MPKEKNYKFDKHNKGLSPTHLVYSDVECILQPGEGDQLLRHIPIAVGYLVVPHPDLVGEEPRYRSFVGLDCIHQFVAALEEEVERIVGVNEERTHQKIQMSEDQKKEHRLLYTSGLDAENNGVQSKAFNFTRYKTHYIQF